MKPAKAAALTILLLFALGAAQGKPKKSAVPAVFETAHYVYVEAASGDILKANLTPEDRQAISEVQERLREWRRYTLTDKRAQADLIFVVRKGRIAGQQDHLGVGQHPQSAEPGGLQPGQTSTLGPTQQRGQFPGISDSNVGSAAEIGPPSDLLRVYTLSADGKLKGPIWSREMDDGLDGPSVRLLQQLMTAVDQAYPPQTEKQPAP